MSGLRPDARQLLEAARQEDLPSRERMARVRSAVLRRAAVGGAAAIVSSSSVWAKAGSLGASAFAKAAALGASATGQVLTYVAAGALAGAAVIQVAVPSRPSREAPLDGTSARDVAVVGRAAPPRLTGVSRGTRAETTPAPSAAEAAPTAGSTAFEPTMRSSSPAAWDDGEAAPVGAPEVGELVSFARPPASAPARAGLAPTPAPALGPPGHSLRERGPSSAMGARATSPEATAAPNADVGAAASAPAPVPVSRDDLRPQLDVLHRMRLDLTARRGAAALALYRANEALFVGSALEPEARVALIAALCLQGLGDEAQRESAALRLAFPNSPLAHRSLGCAASDTVDQTH